MPKLKVCLCRQCETKLRDLQNAHGSEAVTQAAPAILAECRECSKQLPPELVAACQAGQYTAHDKTSDGEGVMREVGRFDLGGRG